MSSSINRIGNEVVIRLPVSEAHSLSVALQPCSCRASKSHATAATRSAFAKGLMRAVSTKLGGEDA